MENHLKKNKPKLLVDWCDHKAAKYACENWHYSKLKPAGSTVHFGVWENDKFIGVVLYGRGVAPNLLSPYGLKVNEGCELIRIALRSHLTPVSKIVSITLKLLKKQFPGLKLVVSFADPNKDHHGGIYQAGNWVYVGKTAKSKFPVLNGTMIHSRTLNHKSKSYKESLNLKWIIQEGKHRYLMPLEESIRIKLKELSKPYPKRASSKDNVAPVNHTGEGGVNPTDALQIPV